MLEFLQAVPGPLFLVVFLCLIPIAIALHDRLCFAGKPLDPSAEAKLTPLELAYLVRGEQGVLETSLVMAQQEKLLDLASTAGRIVPISGSAPSHPATKEVLQDLQRSQGILDGLRMRDTIRNTRTTLIRKGLLISLSTFSALQPAIAIFGTLLALGAIKLALGISNDLPVGFLIASMLALVVIGFFCVFKANISEKPSYRAKTVIRNRKTLLKQRLSDKTTASTQTNAKSLMTALFGFHRLNNSAWGEFLPVVGIALATAPIWLAPPLESRRSAGLFDMSGWSSSSGGGDSGCGGGGGGDSGCGGGGGGCGGCGGGGD